MNCFGEAISQGVKEGRWIDITYKNVSGETTYFWIAVTDIDLKSKRLICDIYNFKKSSKTKSVTIHFDGISRAEPLFFTSYDVPPALIDKLEHADPSSIEWLGYDKFNCNILRYYEECRVLDNDPFQKEYCMIEGIDLAELRKNKKYALSPDQEKALIGMVYHYNYETFGYKELAISAFAIAKDKRKYIVCYYPLSYNPKNKSLKADKALHFNKSFLIEGKKNSLSRYVDGDLDAFIEDFKDKDKYSICREEIESHLKGGEVIDTRPDIFLLQRDMQVNLSRTYSFIEQEYFNAKLSRPLKAFFGNLTRAGKKKKEPSLVIYDNKINVDQLRVLYNSLTQPVTYVQGPPGTGKTQTILNVILCAFVNNRSVLVSSSNNIPVNGIVEKLRFKYEDKDVPFPFLRLGNFEETAKATKRIYELSQIQEKIQPNESLILEILEHNEENTKVLKQKLSDYERRLDIEDLIESGEKLISSFGDQNSLTIRKIKEKVEENKKRLESIPRVEDEEVTLLFKAICNDASFLSYLYFQSYKYIKKLKTERYRELVSICQLKDDSERVKRFNSYIADDRKLALLVNAFPIILTTNISSNKLGTPGFKFDLAIMDEAGQCNVAEALLPIARASNLLLVGDTNQLKPVIILEEDTNDCLLSKYMVDDSYSYLNNSILSVMKEHDSVSKRILLSYHYRCGKKIICYSNKRYYNSELKTKKINFDGELAFIEAKNQNASKIRNQNVDECLQILDYVKRNNVKDATIITPFVNQSDLMNSLLIKEGIKDVKCGTVHSLQGAEKDTIIFSTSISPRTSKLTYEWLKNNAELINVGVTRAKRKLIVVSDYEALDKLSDHSDDLYALVEYVKSNGKFEIAPSLQSINLGKSNGSKAEDDFYQTISQFCSANKTFEAHRNVSFKEIFKDEPVLAKSNMEFDMVLYKKGFFKKKVSIVVEINGGEHFGSAARERCDAKKREICKANGWTFISIPNSFVKSYEEIREIILSTQGKESEQMSLF